MATRTESLFQINTPRIVENFDSGHDIVLKNGDTLEFTKTLPSNTAKLIITSPPYNMGKEYENRTGIQSYLEFQAEVIAELVRILRSDGSLCWQVGNYVHQSEVLPLDIVYYDILKQHGLKLRNRIVWRFNHGLHARKRFSGRYETILWFTKSDTYTFNLDPVRIPSKYPGKRHFKGPNKGLPSGNPLGKNPSDVWEFLVQEWDEAFWDIPNVKANHPEKTAHPCQYPIELVERCVLALTNEQDWVLDPYCGVGSALIAALRHNRKCIGVDKERAYIDLAQNRINDFYAGNLKIRPLGKPVFKPSGREKVSQIPPEWNDSTNGNGGSN